VDLMREGGVNSLEVKGDMNLHVSDDTLARIRLAVAPPPSGIGAEVQFKQHPNVVKFQAQKERIVALKDPTRGFPVNQPLGVLKWRYSGKDETYVPLSSTSFCLCAPLLASVVTRYAQSTVGHQHQTMGHAKSTSSTNSRTNPCQYTPLSFPFLSRE